MATFHDERDEVEAQEGEELVEIEEQEDTTEELESETIEDEVEEEQPEPEPELPAKYRGKSVEEIIKMHQESEKMISRHGEELGNLRKLVDETLTANLAKNNAPQEKAEEIDFFEDPDKYLEQKMANHPTLKAAEQTAQALKQQQAVAQLEKNHPDYMEIVTNDEFQKWVSDSNIRTEMFNRASNNFEYEPADELLSYWKERQRAVTEVVEADKAERKQARKKASTGTAKGSGESPSRKIYRRDDLVNLMKTDPDRYMAMSDEIMRAYAEKRVR